MFSLSSVSKMILGFGKSCKKYFSEGTAQKDRKAKN
jgi:hypothetical protein